MYDGIDVWLRVVIEANVVGFEAGIVKQECCSDVGAEKVCVVSCEE